MSRLARGAWIETIRTGSRSTNSKGRASQGARGLKHNYTKDYPIHRGRASQGARGLKPYTINPCARKAMSRLARGAWIETGVGAWASLGGAVAPRKGRVD